MEERKWDCVTLHDVDKIPTNPKFDYNCHKLTKHMAHPGHFGAVTQMPTDVMRYINGGPTSYFGWGGEDTNIYLRLRAAKGLTNKIVDDICAEDGRFSLEECKSFHSFNPYSVTEINRTISRWGYRNLPQQQHGKEVGNEKNEAKTHGDWHGWSGPNGFLSYYAAEGFHTLNYTVVEKQKLGAFTKITVDVPIQERDQSKMIDIPSLHESHPCLKNMNKLLNCNENMIGLNPDVYLEKVIQRRKRSLFQKIYDIFNINL